MCCLNNVYIIELCCYSVFLVVVGIFVVFLV
jgi:hypothetical protein